MGLVFFFAECRPDDVGKEYIATKPSAGVKTLCYSGNPSWEDSLGLCYPLYYAKIKANYPRLGSS